MMVSRRSIPRMTTAALVLGACNGEPSTRELSASFCASFERCDPVNFAYDYASVGECTDLLTADLDEVLTGYAEAYGAACADSVRDYYECFAAAYADTCDAYAIEDRCAASYDRAYDVCDFEYYG
jgi:hypothetical protein